MKMTNKVADSKAYVYVFFFAIIFPLIYIDERARELGHIIDNYYYAPITLALAALLLIRGKLRRSALPVLTLIILFISFLGYNFDYRTTMCLALILVLSLTPFELNNKSYIIAGGAFLYFISSFPLLFSEAHYIDDGDRFSSFALSPTHFSLYIISSYLILHCSFTNKYLKTSLGILTLFFVLLSGTRLSLALYVLVFIIINFKYLDKPALRIISFIGISVSLALLYPIYQLFFGHSGLGRYEGGLDDSFYSRMLFTGALVSNISSFDLIQLLLGSGTGSAREYIILFFGDDYFPHNDFLRIFHDWGIIGFILFFILLFSISRKTKYTLAASCIYLFSFYHNLIFSFYFIALLFYFYSHTEVSSRK